MKHCFLALHLACGLSAAENLQKEWEAWWEAGHTQMSVWDHSWLTPRLVCGFRFLRIPAKSGIEGGMFLPLPVMGVENERLSGEYTNLERKDEHLLWIFDGTGFQHRALQFYHSGGPPPMEDVWLLTLIAAVPTTLKNNVMSGSALMELQCSAMVLLCSYLFAEYMVMLVPPAVLLKYFQHTWEVHSRVGTVETVDEMMSHFSSFEPLSTAMERFQGILHARSQVVRCASERSQHLEPCLMLQQLGGSVFGGVPVQRPLVDVLIVRCGEDLRWVMEWLKRILRDEWTPEVPGLQVRLVIYEKCLVSEASTAGAAEPGPSGLSGQQLLDDLRDIEVIHPGSVVIELKEPEGFENVAYVHYCMSKAWRNADFVMFLHGSPFDHTNERMLDDVLRSMAQGTYGVPFVHLNINRLPRIAVEPCLQVLIRPALNAWHAGPADLPLDMSTYCCTQFVVSRQRMERVPDGFGMWSGNPCIIA